MQPQKPNGVLIQKMIKFLKYDEHSGYPPDNYEFYEQQFCPVVGVDGWGAIEYRFRDIPLNISLNIKPYLELVIPLYARFMPADIGLSVSYVF